MMQPYGSTDYNGFATGLSGGKYEACGGGPIAVLLKMASLKKGSKVNVIQYLTSGDVSGDKSQVVGYMAACFTSR